MNRDVAHPDSFGARSTLNVGGTSHEIFRLEALQASHDTLETRVETLATRLLAIENGRKERH